MKIAIIDSGVHAEHPHVQGVSGGIGVAPSGLVPDFTDRLGHGTAVAAAIREKTGAAAELYAVRVFDSRLSAQIDVILEALNWCSAQHIDIVNLSLGTSNPAHRERFEAALENGPLVVSAAGFMPGDLPAAIGVAADEDCPRDTYRYRQGIFYASPFPRPIPGVAKERNLQGQSFAVANMTGLAACVLLELSESQRTSASREMIFDRLITRSQGFSGTK